MWLRALWNADVVIRTHLTPASFFDENPVSGTKKFPLVWNLESCGEWRGNSHVSGNDPSFGVGSKQRAIEANEPRRFMSNHRSHDSEMTPRLHCPLVFAYTIQDARKKSVLFQPPNRRFLPSILLEAVLIHCYVKL